MFHKTFKKCYNILLLPSIFFSSPAYFSDSVSPPNSISLPLPLPPSPLPPLLASYRSPCVCVCVCAGSPPSLPASIHHTAHNFPTFPLSLSLSLMLVAAVAPPPPSSSPFHCPPTIRCREGPIGPALSGSRDARRSREGGKEGGANGQSLLPSFLPPFFPSFLPPPTFQKNFLLRWRASRRHPLLTREEEESKTFLPLSTFPPSLLPSSPCFPASSLVTIPEHGKSKYI